MRIGLNAVALLFSGIPLGHAAGLKAAMPPPKQTNSTTDANSMSVPANFTIPDSNSTLAEGAKSGSGSGGKSGSGSGGKFLGDRDSACCAGKPESLMFELTTNDCDASNNHQGGKFECYPDDSSLVAGTDYFIGGAHIVESNPFQVGDYVTIEPRSGKFPSNTVIKIFDSPAGSIGRTLVQRLSIHTSCSKQLDLGDIFGALTLVNYGPRPIECAVCVNDMSGSDQDTGCSAFEPLCDGEPEEAGEACSACTNDKLRGLQDTGCTEECKLCDANPGAFGDECKVCENDKDGGAQDSGCPIENPLCIALSDDYGDECALCYNDNIRSVPDSGCPREHPVCNANENQHGYECLVCRADSSLATDPGCDISNPICNGIAQTDFQGSGCFKCQNSNGPGPDRGCTTADSCPHCVAPIDGFGVQCAFCINDEPAGDVDTGCTTTSPLCVADWDQGGALCARCINDQPDDQQDTGCSDLDFPRCNADFGEPGEVCEARLTPFPIMQQGDTFPAIDGQTSNMDSQGGGAPTDTVCGAIQAVLAHPDDPDICFAGAVNGGVWRTTTCTDAQPNWEPLSDQEDSLSIGDMVFDESDPSRNTILAAIGTRSSFGRRGGPAIGMLFTLTALTAAVPTWQVLDNSAGTINFRINRVKFRSAYVRGDLMLAAAYEAVPGNCATRGVFRSTDRGVTWTNVLSGVALAIASDPNDEMRFYATLDGTGGVCGAPVDNGVFTSNDGGATWALTGLATNIPAGQLNNAKLSVSRDQSRVWSALLRNGRADSISYSDDQGASWTTMDDVLVSGADTDTGLNPREKPGGQGAIHFALLASPTNRNEVYVGGDRQADNFEQDDMAPRWPNNLGAQDYTGILFRGDASVTGTGMADSPQWEHMTDSNAVGTTGSGTANSSGPHADCRDMEIRADGSILEGDDGGITLRTSPTDNTGDWFGLCGNMQAFETHSIAYEPVLNTLLFGNQDTGTIYGTLGSSGTFSSLSTADGNACMIDFTSDANNLYLYYGRQNFGRMFRATVSKSSGAIVTTIDTIRTNWGGFFGTFVSITAMNPMDQRIFAVATNNNNVLPANGRPTGPFNMIQITTNRGIAGSFSTIDSMYAGSITAMEWSADGSYLYVASGSFVKRCTITGCPAAAVFVGFSVSSLAVDPYDRNVVYAVTTASRAFETIDGGTTWTDITVGGSLLDSGANQGSAVAYIRKDDVATVVVGTTNGVLVPDDGTSGWQLLAVGLPKALVYDMVYDESDDILVVATIGRGVWYLNLASQAVKSTSFAPSEWVPVNEDNVLGGGSEVNIKFDSVDSLNYKYPPDDDPGDIDTEESPELAGL